MLLDTQFTTDHLKRFGAIDVPRRRYEKLLAEAVEGQAVFHPEVESDQLVLASLGRRHVRLLPCSPSARRHRSACSTALRPGLSANIQPVKMRRILRSSVISSTSTKESVFGSSVVGRE